MKIEVRLTTQNGETFAGEVTLKQVSPNAAQSVRSEQKPAKPRPESPSAAINALYEKGFFSEERSLGDSVRELRGNGYNFGAPSIVMALKTKEFLQRRGTKGKYRFVQKYPPSQPSH